MLSFKKHLSEKLKASDDMGTWVKDFQDSDAPQFKGKSKEKKRKMAVAAKLGAEREAGMREAVEVSHDRYMRSHGKKASGGHGQWLFTHKRMGDVDFKNDKEVHQASGKFSDAAKSAKAWAKKHGHSIAYVMEHVDLDEARKSDSYQFTHKPGDAESEKRLADLKKSVKGTGKRVVLQGRLGKDNPNAHKYSKDAPSAKYKDGKRVNSDVSGKSGGHSHQRIQKADAAHHDVYVYRREEVELDEGYKATSEKSQFGGHRAHLKNPEGKTSYLSGTSYKTPKHARGEAQAYHDAYFNTPGIKANEHGANRAVRAYREKHKEHLYKNESVNEGWDDMLKAAAERKKPQPNGGAGKKQGSRYGGSKQKDEPMKESQQLDELSPNLLHRYVKKAAGNMGLHAADHGKYGDQQKDKQSLNKAKKRLSGITSASGRLADKANAANESLDLQAQYDLVESYLVENNIDVNTLSEEQLNEIIGKVVGGAFKVGAKAAVGAGRLVKKAADRMSTSGRADAAEKRAAAAEKKNKDRERLRAAQERLRAARQSASNK